jgi:hypothetical protein
MSNQEILEQVKNAFRAEQTPLERAQLLEKIAYAAYDVTKADFPGGAGFDGADGPERRGVGAVLRQAIAHADAERAAANNARTITFDGDAESLVVGTPDGTFYTVRCAEHPYPAEDWSEDRQTAVNAAELHVAVLHSPERSNG